MKFLHSETYNEYAHRIGMWHRKFLWLPTRVNDKNTRWLEFTWRRATAYYGISYHAVSTTEYEYLPYVKQKPVDDKILVSYTANLTTKHFASLGIETGFYSYEQEPNLKAVNK